MLKNIDYFVWANFKRLCLKTLFTCSFLAAPSFVLSWSLISSAFIWPFVAENTKLCNIYCIIINQIPFCIGWQRCFNLAECILSAITLYLDLAESSLPIGISVAVWGISLCKNMPLRQNPQICPTSYFVQSMYWKALKTIQLPLALVKLDHWYWNNHGNQYSLSWQWRHSGFFMI